jgi:hypothetical protein
MVQLSRQTLDVSRDVVGLGATQRKIHLAMRSDQIENQRFGIEAVLSSNREEGRSIRNEIVAGTAGHDVTGGAPLLGQASAALDIGGLSLQGRKRKRKTTGNPIHLPPPNSGVKTASAGSGLFTLIRVNRSDVAHGHRSQGRRVIG